MVADWLSYNEALFRRGEILFDLTPFRAGAKSGKMNRYTPEKAIIALQNL